MWFTRVSLHNPVFATMVLLALVVLGLFSYQRLQVDQFPNIDFPVVVVTTDYPGAAPEIMESEVTKKIEESVNTVAGIHALTSRSYEDRSIVVIEFQLHIDGRKAAEDVRDRISAMRPLLRAEVKEPRVQRFDPTSSAIWSVAVLSDDSATAPLSALERSNWAEQVLKKRLENVRGVGAISLVGSTRREINAYLEPQALEAHGVGAAQVASALRSENNQFPLGVLHSAVQEQGVTLDARIQRPEDFGQLIVARQGASNITLGQLSRIHDGAQEINSLALRNGVRTLLLSVQKAQDANTVQVVEGLLQSLAALGPELPPGVRLEPVFDSARTIRVSLDSVRRTLIEGAALTMLIVFLFLNSWRSTVITGLTLPIALIGTFFFMDLLGFSINMITLIALSLCVGLLIDDAIVVRENIVRHLQMGKSPHRAALEGTQEIGLAVLATTLSIVAVFLPMGFMGGIIGKFFHDFGLTIAAAVLISMLVSFTLDPMLSSLWHDPAIKTSERAPAKRSLYNLTLGRLTNRIEQATETLSEVYQRLLGWSLRHPLAIILLGLAVFVSSLALVPLLGSEFLPKADFSETTIKFHTPIGSSLELTEAKARQVDTVLRAMPEVRSTLTTINSAEAIGKSYASVYVRLVERKQRERDVEQISEALRERLRHIAGITVTHVGVLDIVSAGKQIEFSLQGPSLNELERLTALVNEKMQAIPGLVDLDTSLKQRKPGISISVNRAAAADLGLGMAHIGGALRILIAGETVGSWRAPDDNTYDINLRLAPEARNNRHDLTHLPFHTRTVDGQAGVVRLNQLATLHESSGPNQINRRNMTREVTLTGNVHQRSAGEVTDDIREQLAQITLPPGYRYQFIGSAKNMDESLHYALSTLVLAILFIYMILASQFKSFLQPLALMAALPLALLGVVLALLMFGSTLSIFSLIGVIMLMGLITKNAILLVDLANRVRIDEYAPDGTLLRAGLARTPALLLAARVRLRPIMMTTLAMIFGMLPLALTFSEGSEQRAPMAQAVIGGVITSSLLTLVVVPVVYCYLDDLSAWLQRRFSRISDSSDSSHEKPQ